jgi:predicted Zn-dependent protease
LAFGLIAVAFTLIRGCQEGPFGRNQLIVLSQEQEMKLGAQAFTQVLQEEGRNVVLQGELPKVVSELAGRLIKAREHPEFVRLTGVKPVEYEWEVRVVDKKEVNAFCLPGGKIVVFTGIIPVAESEAGLATVMGHEIAHALARHGNERMSQQQVASIALNAAGASLGDLDPRQREQVLQALNVGARVKILQYGRSHESEADHMGLVLMALAGYDPNESIKFWERMKRVTGDNNTPVYMRTHPTHDTRISDLTSWIPEALPLYKKAPSTPDRDLLKYFRAPAKTRP